MSNVILRADNNLLGSLTPTEKKILTAALSEKVNEMAPLAAVGKFSSVVLTAYHLAGQKPDEANLFLIAEELYKEVSKRIPAIGIDEVTEALRCGVLGDYGEYFGINVKSMLGFVKSYYYSPERVAARRAYYDIVNGLKKEPVKPSEQFIREQNRDLINLLYSDFLNGKISLGLIPAFLCKFLIKEKRMKVSKIIQSEYMERAEFLYHQQVKKTTFISSLGDRIESYMKTDKPEVTIRNLGMAIAVQEFFINEQRKGTKLIFFPHPILTKSIEVSKRRDAS